MTRNSSERGSSFFLILIGIAIFAALSYAVLQGGRVSQSQLSGDQARVAAQEIIQYADAVGKAVQAMRLRGCSEREISFEGVGVANPLAPADESCHVFSLNGGKVNFKPLDSTYHLGTNGTSGVWRYTANNDILGIGTNSCGDDSCADLILYVRDLKSDICTAIEKILSGDPAIPEDEDVDGSASFDSTYDGSPAVIGDVDMTNKISGRGAACILDTSGNYFTFYHVLIAR